MCSFEDCSKPVKAKGLCRHHYDLERLSKYQCTIENCTNPPHTIKSGLCNAHTGRLKRHGDPLKGTGSRSRGSKEERFLAKFKQGNPTLCWNWECSIGNHGYGQLHIKNETLLSHRLSYEYFRGPIPDGLTIDHLCRNTRCVNPNHLGPATNSINVQREWMHLRPPKGWGYEQKCAITTCDKLVGRKSAKGLCKFHYDDYRKH